MKLFLSVLGFLFIAAWLIEMWVQKHTRARRERERSRARSARWWQEHPRDDDLGDDY